MRSYLRDAINKVDPQRLPGGRVSVADLTPPSALALLTPLQRAHVAVQRVVRTELRRQFQAQDIEERLVRLERSAVERRNARYLGRRP